MPGQASHCCVGVTVGAKRSVVVGEGMGVTEAVGVSVDVGKEAGLAVSVNATDVWTELMGDKPESGLVVPGLHASSRNITAIIKNIKKFFLIRMAASIE